ncbi:MAG: TolC family protein [Planctomycetes bacterium]|nr:TolC family protein [Planctomycetota bacterium]
MRFRLVLLVVLAMLVPMVLAGCRGTAGEERLVDTIAPPEKLRKVEALDLEAFREAGKEAEAPPAEASLTLEECRAAALEGNLDLKAALVDPAVAEEAVNQEEAKFEALFFSNVSIANTDTPTSSTLDAAKSTVTSANVGIQLPLATGGTITLDIPVSRSKTNNAFSTLNPAYTSDFSASISQPLLRGGGARAAEYSIRIARCQQRIVEARTKLEVTRVIADVDRQYWLLYAARGELEVRRNEYDLAVALARRARRMAKAGTAKEVDVIGAETGVAERLEAVITAQALLRRSERDLKRLLNKPGLGVRTPTVLLPATRPDPVHHNLDTARLVDAAVENRMEMLELELRIAQDQMTVDFQRNQALVSLALGYTYSINGLGGTAGDSFDVLADKNFEDHWVGLTLEIPLGNAAARSRLRQALATRVGRLATREARRAEIEREVLNAADNIETNWQRLAASRQRTALAARNLEAEERQFGLGMQTSTDVLDAQTRLADARSAQVRSLADYQNALVDLAYATGTLLGKAHIEWEPTAPLDPGD